MTISIYNIKRWMRMLTGTSIEHVSQELGKVYSPTEIKGYYNDLTEKVLKDKDFSKVKVPVLRIENGTEILFPITIFQYGLGAYDLYLLNNKKLFLDKFNTCVEWAIDNQRNDGSWNTFFFKKNYSPYSAMAQGEGISLLTRAYKTYNKEKYLLAIKKAMDFMIIPVDRGGTTKYADNGVFFQEVPNMPTVLNGWIFSIFGVYDYLKMFNDEKIKLLYDRSIQTMIYNLKDFDNGYWSKYDNKSMIASPFYHKLHIAQLDALYDLTKQEIFKTYSIKWSKYQSKGFNNSKAFLIKAVQKLTNEY